MFLFLYFQKLNIDRYIYTCAKLCFKIPNKNKCWKCDQRHVAPMGQKCKLFKKMDKISDTLMHEADGKSDVNPSTVVESGKQSTDDSYSSSSDDGQ